jgi:hypothetical protein
MEPQNNGKYLMKAALKGKNDEFLAMPLKHVQSVMDLENHSGTPKMWAIGYENGPKTQKQRFFGHASQTCTEWHGPCKSPGTPKLWAIAHKNSHTHKNDMFFLSFLSKMYRLSYSL